VQNKSITYPSLKPINKNQQEDMKFTFDPAKCDRIFAELLKFGYIKLSHALSSLEESKKGLIANGITLSLMGLMITMFSIGRFNRLSVRDDESYRDAS
jgi:hypothetical protein